MLFRISLFLSAILIYWDATRHHIGKIKGEKGFLNMPAGGWALLGIMLGPIGWYLYWDNRDKLIAKAKSNPVEVKMLQKIIVWALLLSPFGLMGYFIWLTAK